jgi:DNA-directed RNA polymerase specialized sigma24 family protein
MALGAVDRGTGLTVPAEQVAMAMRMYAQLVGAAWRMAGQREDGEDLVGDALLRLVQRPPRARSEAQLRKWLLVVVERRLVDLRRRPHEISIDLLTGW